MKLIQSTVKGIEYKFICLENKEDVLTYQCQFYYNNLLILLF